MQDPLEPILLFTKPLVPEKLAAAGIVPPTDSSTRNNVSSPPCKFRGRIGRGGRIIFDRWNPLLQTPIDCGNSFYIPPKPRSSTYNWCSHFALSHSLTGTAAHWKQTQLIFVWWYGVISGNCRLINIMLGIEVGIWCRGREPGALYIFVFFFWCLFKMYLCLVLAHVNYYIA